MLAGSARTITAFRSEHAVSAAIHGLHLQERKPVAAFFNGPRREKR